MSRKGDHVTQHSLPDNVLTLLHDAARCLALAERGALTVLPGGTLPRTSWRLLRDHTAAGQAVTRLRCEADVPTLSWLFRSLGSGGLLGVVGGQIRLAQTAYDWLALPPPAQVAALRQLWRCAPEIAWAWLPRSTDYQTYAHAWRELTGQLVATVAALPTATWVLVADVRTDLAQQAATLNFGVAGNLPRVRQALARQANQLVTFWLSELLPRLGVVVVQDQAVGPCLAVTPEGAAWLRTAWRLEHLPAAAKLHGDPQPAANAMTPTGACWQVTVDLRVLIPLDAPAGATFEALQFTDLQSLGPPAAYCITRASLERATAHGDDLSDVLFHLAHGSAAPLAGPVVAQLTRWRDELSLIHCEPGYRLRPAQPAALAVLRARAPFRAATELTASGHAAFVSQAESPALLRYLRRCGYLVRLSGQGEPGTGAPPSSRRSCGAGCPCSRWRPWWAAMAGCAPACPAWPTWGWRIWSRRCWRPCRRTSRRPLRVWWPQTTRCWPRTPAAPWPRWEAKPQPRCPALPRRVSLGRRTHTRACA